MTCSSGTISASLSTAGVRKNAKDLVKLSDTDVRDAEEVVKILKPLKTLTTLLCSEQSPTTSLILPAAEGEDHEGDKCG